MEEGAVVSEVWESILHHIALLPSVCLDKTT